MLSDMELDDLDRLEKAATPSPWKSSQDEPSDVVIWGPGDDEFLCNIGRSAVQNMSVAFDCDQANGDLIAAARNALPTLITSLREARAKIVELEPIPRDSYARGFNDHVAQCHAFGLFEAAAESERLFAENEQLRATIAQLQERLAAAISRVDAALAEEETRR